MPKDQTSHDPKEPSRTDRANVGPLDQYLVETQGHIHSAERRLTAHEELMRELRCDGRDLPILSELRDNLRHSLALLRQQQARILRELLGNRKPPRS